MAQADFDFLPNTGFGFTSPSGGTDGTTVFHTDLANPLTGNGDWGRQYIYGGTPHSSLVGAISASIDGGVWVGTPNTHALSLRASVRLASPSPGGANGRCVGVIAKTGVIGVPAVPRAVSGYALIYGQMYVGFSDPAWGNALGLVCHDEGIVNWSSRLDVNIATLALDTWHRIRMDVIPSGSNDIIKVYTGTGPVGSEVWTLLHTELILGAANYYCNWGDPTSNRVGYFSHCDGAFEANKPTYIDAFVAQREAV